MVLPKSRIRDGRSRALTLVVLVEVVAVLLAGGTALLLGTSDGPAAPTAGPAPTPSAAAPTTPPPTADPSAPILQPGRPGESAQVLDPGQVTPGPGPTHNTADLRFVQMMIPHHEQALEMAALVPQRAGSAGVIAVADRIRSAQQPEVEVLRSWLRDRGFPVPEEGHTNHDPGAMHGMQTPEAISGLAGMTGTDFDRRFVEMMTAHHEGAIAMAQEVLTNGVNQQIRELARNIAFEQAVEVSRMREIVAPPAR